jgi:hypothetical protein
VVFYGVVRATWKHLGHLRPFVAVGSVSQEKDPLLLRHPLHFKNARVEMVVPSLPTLLPQSALHEPSDEGPPLRPVLLNQLSH